MKRAFILLPLLFAAPLLRGQDSGAAAAAGPSRQEALENYKSLKGEIENLMDAKNAQDKRIQELEAQIRELKTQVAAKPSGNFATQEDFKRLSEAIEKVDKARVADNEATVKSLDAIKKAVKASVVAPPPPRRGSRGGDADSGPPAGGTSVPNPSQDMLQYEVKDNDTLIKISRKLLAEKGIKITPEKILEANPGTTATNLKVSQKLLIPVSKPPTGTNQ